MPYLHIPASAGISYLRPAGDVCCATANPRACCTCLLIVGECCYLPVTDPRSGLLRQQCTNDWGHFYQRGCCRCRKIGSASMSSWNCSRGVVCVSRMSALLFRFCLVSATAGSRGTSVNGRRSQSMVITTSFRAPVLVGLINCMWRSAHLPLPV